MKKSGRKIIAIFIAASLVLATFGSALVSALMY